MVRALRCVKLGDPTRLSDGVLRVDDVPRVDVVPPEGVRVAVHAAALNFADLLQCRGLYQERPPLPFTPGGEFSGVITEVGDAVTSAFKVGDAVAGVLVGGGAMASEVVVPRASAQCFAVPSGVDLSAAAAFPVAYGTAHVALAHRARLRAGQTVLVTGAGGGVGMAAVQIAKAMGATVIAVARGEEKLDACASAGADYCLDSDALRTPPRGEERGSGGDSGGGASSSSAAFAGLRKAVTALAPATRRGVDVFFDNVGGAAFKSGVKCVAWGGQVLVIGFASGEIPTLAMNVPLVKNVTVHGVYWGSYATGDPATFQASARETTRLLREGKLRVRVSHSFALDDASEAFRALAERRAIGKVVVTCQGEGEGVGAAKL